ncbi:hypothetical protein LTR67_006365 [Exophiala xenobiotica]
MVLANTSSSLIVVGLVLITFLVVFVGLLFLQLTILRRVRLQNEEEPRSAANVALRYMNKPLPQAPYNGHAPINSFRKTGNPQTRRPMVEDGESECENETVHPLFRRRDKNPARRTGDFSDLPLQSIRAYKPTLKAANSQYTGETLKSYTPSIRNREPQVQEQQEVTFGLDQGIPKTPTPATRSVSSRPWLTVDVIPEEQGKIFLPLARNV